MTITNNSLIGDLRTAQAIGLELRMYLADTSNLKRTPFFVNVGSVNGRGSDTIRVPLAALDGAATYTSFAAGNEANAVADSALVDGHADVVVVRRAVRRSLSDLADLIGPNGQINVEKIAMDLAKSYGALFASLTATAITSFTASAGTTLTALSLDAFYDAMQTLTNTTSGKVVPGPYVCLLHPKQYNELQDSIRAEVSNAVAFSPATVEQLAAKGDYYKGSFMGVEIYVSSLVTDDTSDLIGAMWGPGALGFGDGSPNIPAINPVMQMEDVTIEIARDADTAVTSVVGHVYLGISILEDERGTKLISKLAP